jgi:hypothetical protein
MCVLCRGLVDSIRAAGDLLPAVSVSPCLPWPRAIFFGWSPKSDPLYQAGIDMMGSTENWPKRGYVDGVQRSTEKIIVSVKHDAQPKGVWRRCREAGIVSACSPPQAYGPPRRGLFFLTLPEHRETRSQGASVVEQTPRFRCALPDVSLPPADFPDTPWRQMSKLFSRSASLSKS